MKTFIVHIRREGKEAVSGPIGTVEEAGSDTENLFNGFDELCRIMSGVESKKKIVTKGEWNNDKK